LGAGTALAAATPVVSLLAACNGSTDADEPFRSATLDLGTEVGVLNFAYAVTQLELDFYTRVVNNKFPGMLASESTNFNNFFNATSNARGDLWQSMIPAGRITDTLLFRLGELVDFASRSSVFGAAQAIEDAAARGLLAATTMVTTPATVTALQDLASAAAARADTIRGSVVTPTPLAPATVMTTLAPYYLTTFTIHNG